MTPDRSNAHRLSGGAAALVELARNSLGPMSEAERAAGLNALRDRLGRRQIARRRRWSAVAAAGVAAGAALVGMLASHRRVLSLRVDGGAIEPGGNVVATVPSGAPVLHFSDGSEITLRSGALVRVRSIDDRGARVTLDEGEARVDVVHASDTRWTFEAGPFRVAVTGTVFGLSWHPSGSQLDLRLENGAVTVTGPPVDAPLALRSGQWLNIRGSDVTIRALADGPPPAVPDGTGSPAGPTQDAAVSSAPAAPNASPRAPAGAPNASPSAPAGAPNASPSAPAGAPNASPSAHDHIEAVEAAGRRAGSERPEDRWRAELAAGQFTSIVDQALALGLEVALQRTSESELWALADAARYTRHTEIARRALQSETRRFPGSEHAHAAAFFLGRMAEAEGDARSSLDWFDAYLTEAPSGTYAPEALGRKMTLVEKLEGKGAARSLAESYLRRFPGGAYADAAHALLANAP
jgi:hypothetical protein